MLDVMMRLGESVFQSSEVRGAVCSGDLELESNANGVSLYGAGSRLLDDRLKALELTGVALAGNDHSLR